MQKPRNSILQLFDPLMANSPRTPGGRELATASPESSDKENELPSSSTDPLSLTQFFERTYKVDHYPKETASRTPKGRLIDFGDLTINDDDQLVSISLDSQELLQLDDEPFCGEDLENATPFVHPDAPPEAVSRVENRPQLYTTPQNRKILADLDVDMCCPPKRPLKRGTLKISFLRHALDTKSATSTAPVSGPSSLGNLASEGASGSAEEASAQNANQPHDSPGIPMIALHPPLSDPLLLPESVDSKIPANNNKTCLSPEISSYFGDSALGPIPRRTLSSNNSDAHRISMDLQASFQLQLQNSEFSFDLVNDRVSFFGGQESFLKGIDEGSDADLERKDMDELVERTSAVLAAGRIFKTPNSSVPSSPISDTASSVISGATVSLMKASESIPDLAVTEPVKVMPALPVVKKVHRHQESTSSSDSMPTSDIYSGSMRAERGLRLPMRVPIPQRSMENPVSIQNAIRAPTRLVAAATVDSKLAAAPKPVAVVQPQTELIEGPKRVLIHPQSTSNQSLANGGKPFAAPGTVNGWKGVGPQRVLVRPSPSAPSNAISTATKRMISNASSSAVAPHSRIPGPSAASGPSRIAGLAGRTTTKIGQISKFGIKGKKV